MSMSRSKEPLRISAGELFSPRVDAYLEEQAMLGRGVADAERQPFIVRMIYSSYFYLSVASGLGAFVAWLILEPFIDDHTVGTRPAEWLVFPTLLAFVGLFLGAAEGIMCRNLQRAAICAGVGTGVGFAGGLGAILIAGAMFIVVQVIVVVVSHARPDQPVRPSGLGFLVLMMGRAASWAVAAIPAGIGQGIALRESKVVLNGLLGSVLGGLLGGMAFDPISLIFVSADGQAWPSRAVGFTVIGLMVGMFVGMVEQWTKTAWLLMKAGPLAGKQFVVFRNPTVLGSAPKADVYLFKDEAIEPRHALIHDRGGRFEIEDMETADGTYVNGIPVRRQILRSGDQIVLGKTVLEFALKEVK
jgi:Inner membrane component of T3SS, cytoplasmic domain